MKIKSLITIAFCSAALSAFAFDEIPAQQSAAKMTIVEVNGEKFTYMNLEQKLPGVMFQARNAFYTAERKALDDFVDNYLLEQQAKKENLTVDQLLDKHIKSMMPPDPSEAALRVFYEGIDTKEPFEAVKDKIMDSLHQKRSAKIKEQYIQSLRAQANIAFRLPPPRANVSMKDVPLRGPANAPVTIVEYADYECPYCQQIQPLLDKVATEYKGKVAFAYKDMPLPMHSHAQKAAEAAHCAGDQNKYWEFHDKLYSERMLDVAGLKSTAQSLGLDMKAFDACLDSGSKAEMVKKSFTEGQTLQIQGTPSFLINGRFYSGGFTWEQLQGIMDEELGQTSAKQTAQK